MQKSVVEILENILDETKREHKNLKGGRKKYLNDLQDSDDFHNESHSEGEIYILEKLLGIFRDQKVENLNIPMSKEKKQEILDKMVEEMPELMAYDDGYESAKFLQYFAKKHDLKISKKFLRDHNMW